jgi:CRISPR-associated endonuclease Cas3-HD
MPDHPLDTFQARPGQTLWRHKQGVVAGAEALTAEAGSTPYDDDWATVLETLAWTHDAGKLTEYFQTYVETGTRSSAPYDELTYHGLVGALLAAYALHSRDCAPETVTAGFYAVMKHHSVLGNVRTDFREYFEQNKQAVDNRYEMVGKQLASIDETAAAAADTLLRKATDGALGWDAVPSDNPAKLRKSLEMLESCVMDPAFYGCVLRSWSTLVAADKFDAGGLTTPASANGLTRPPRPRFRRSTRRSARSLTPSFRTARWPVRTSTRQTDFCQTRRRRQTNGSMRSVLGRMPRQRAR